MQFIKLIIFAGLIANLSAYSAAEPAGPEAEIIPRAAAAAGGAAEDVETKRAQTVDPEATQVMWSALRKQDAEALREILASGRTNANQRNDVGQSPLGYVAERLLKPELIRVLLAFKADQMQPVYMSSASAAGSAIPFGRLLMSRIYNKNYIGILNALLLNSPGLVNAKINGVPPLIMVVNKLLDPSAVCEVIRWLTTYGASIEIPDEEGHDAFYYAKNPKILKCLNDSLGRLKGYRTTVINAINQANIFGGGSAPETAPRRNELEGIMSEYAR